MMRDLRSLRGAAHRRDAARSAHGVRISWALFGALAVIAWAPAPAHAGDDWSLERKKDDPALTAQRMTKLRRNPFDRRQFAALQKSIGLSGLAHRVRAALQRDPDDVQLRILEALVLLAEDKPKTAAEKLEALQSEAGRWEPKVFDLRVDALEGAAEYESAALVVEKRAETTSRQATKIALLERAHHLAERGNHGEATLRLAQKLATYAPDDFETHLRVARAAHAAGESKLADRAYAAAIEKARRGQDDLIAERARARLEADNPSGAAKLLWSLLESPRRGSKTTRQVWWEQLAAAHRRARTTDKLINELRRWLKSNDDEVAAWHTLAQAQESVGIDPVPAWKQALKRDPRDDDIAARLVEALEAKGDIDGAIEAYRSLLNRSPREIEVGLDLASRMAVAGQREQALALAEEIEKRVGRRTHGLMLLLDFYNLNDEPDRALEVAHRLVAAAPRKPEARLALGEQLYQMNRVTEAIEQWSKLPTMYRPAHKGWAKHAQVLSEHGRTSEAVASLTKALKLAPREPSYLRLRAVLAEEQRRPTQALELWEEVRRLAIEEDQRVLRDEARTRSVELLVGGSIPKRRFKLERAQTDAQAMLDRGEPLAQALEAGRFLAELHTRRENYSAAVRVQHRLLELDPADPQRLEELAAAQRRAGQVKSALGTLEELLDAEPGRRGDVLAEMSELAFEAGDDDRALKAATRAAEHDQHQVEALVRLGRLHERRGDMDAAARAYRRALSEFPSDARARLHLAELELTQGNVSRSAKLLREILEQGGPPELMREAGQRALDLAEASDSLMDLLAMAVRRTSVHPEADEPREFLLATLTRLDVTDVRRWVDEGSSDQTRSDKQRDLRSPLVASLSRGSIGARMAAAEHLGRLGLPDTAVPLARMAATLTAPRDATLTVRGAFERTRLSAIVAAGSLADPAATETFVELLEDPRYELEARRAAAWALSQLGSNEAAQALGRHLRSGTDDQIATWACAALATTDPDVVGPELAARAAELARDTRQTQVRHACAFAEAAMTPQRRAPRLRTQLRSSDPTLAAVAAWRLGQLDADEATIEALLRRYMGPHGLARDAAGAALARLLDDDATVERPAPPLPPAANENAWGVAVERWLHAEVAPKYGPVSAESMLEHRDAIRGAYASALAGTRAEQAAAERLRRDCAGPKSICLRPLVETPLPAGE